MTAPRRQWTRDEAMLAYRLYCEIPFGQMHRGNPRVVQLSEVIGRTPSAVAMKLGNFAHLDPALQQRGIRGMSTSAPKIERSPRYSRVTGMTVSQRQPRHGRRSQTFRRRSFRVTFQPKLSRRPRLG